MSSNTLYEPELPPYEVCSKPSYTKENIDEFKEQLESIENELLNIKSNDIRKPQLRRQAADLEEIIITFENTKPIPEIVQSLNDNIELLSEYVDLEEISHWDFINKLTIEIFIDDIDWSYRSRNDFTSKIICKTDLKLFIDHLKKKFPIYSNAIEKNCNEASINMFSSTKGHTFDCLLDATKNTIKTQGIAAQARRNEIKHFIDETQLNFNKKLSSFIENIINEKKQMEDRILELENKVNVLIRLAPQSKLHYFD
jgi:hypothetical protein